MFSNAIYMIPYDFGPGMVSKYLKCNLTKIFADSAEVNVAANINDSSCAVEYNRERFYLVKVIGNG